MATSFEECLGQEIPSVSSIDFKWLGILGEGSFGKVIAVKKFNGIDDEKLYAMKVIKKKPRQQNSTCRAQLERDVMANSCSPFVMRLYYALQTEAEVFLVMQYHRGGDLSVLMRSIGQFSEENTKFYAAEIILGIDHIHQLGVIHRDLKPENVMIGGDGHVVLADFGLCGWDRISRDQCGTKKYMAPEMFKAVAQTVAVDWWALGAIMYEMLSGVTLFRGVNMRDKSRHFVIDKNLRSSLSPETISLLSGLLDVKAKRRLGSRPEGVENIMFHPFFKRLDWASLITKKQTAPYVPTGEDSDLLYKFPSHYSSCFFSSTSEESAGPTLDSRDQEQYRGFSYCHPTVQENIELDEMAVENNPSMNEIMKQYWS